VLIEIFDIVFSILTLPHPG